MIALIIHRIIQSIIVMLAVALVAFTLFRYVGDPVSQMVGQETSIADMERLREELGLNDPIIVQFASFVWNTVQGKFGISYRLGRPVNQLFRTLFFCELVICSHCIIWFLDEFSEKYTGRGIFSLHKCDKNVPFTDKGMTIYTMIHAVYLISFR